jgi:hypothetical protein
VRILVARVRNDLDLPLQLVEWIDSLAVVVESSMPLASPDKPPAKASVDRFYIRFWLTTHLIATEPRLYLELLEPPLRRSRPPKISGQQENYPRPDAHRL